MPAKLDGSQTPRGVGLGAAYRPPLADAAPRCTRATARFAVHLELFAHGRVVLIPAGIGAAPPLVRAGPYVRSARCYAAARTREPTGVVETAPGVTLGDFFALWGQPLDRRRLAGFGPGRVALYVDGSRRSGNPRAVVLRRHAEIVLEIAGHVPPHHTYRFAPGS